MTTQTCSSCRWFGVGRIDHPANHRKSCIVHACHLPLPRTFLEHLNPTVAWVLVISSNGYCDEFERPQPTLT